MTIHSKHVKWAIAGLIAVGIIYGFWKYVELSENLEKARLKNANLNNLNNKLLNHNLLIREQLEILSKNANATDHALHEQLHGLLVFSKDFDDKMRLELEEISTLVVNGNTTKAILSLNKIIENLLKYIYPKMSNSGFYNYADKAQKDGILSKEEFHHLMASREIRNEEAHEMGVKKKAPIAFATITLCLIVISKLLEVCLGQVKAVEPSI